MASIITATVSSGLTQQADNSGVLQLASGTGNLVTVPSVTGTAMVSGNMPAFSAYQSTGQTLSSSTWTKVQLQSEEFDTANYFDSTTNYRFTPLIAGYYQVNGSVQTQTSVNTAVTRCSIYKNGSAFKDGVQMHHSTTKVASSIVSALIYFNGSTDYVELYVFQDTGFSSNTQNLANTTYFQASMVRSA